MRTGGQFLHPRSQVGQAIVLIAFMIVVLFAGVGIAVDAGIGYYYNTSAERAAAAGALSGVIFMPTQLDPSTAIPAGSGNDATDRAYAEAQRNGFDRADTTDNVQVAVAAVPGASNKLQVTVSRSVVPFFMQVFGIGTYSVKRVAIATYLPPLSIGQPGAILGSTVSQIGTANNYYLLRFEGWSVDRGQGDAFTPNPSSNCGVCPSSDVHQISQVQGTDLADTSLPTRGGYNYKIVVPTGTTARVQVYNAAFAPDGGNQCENWSPAIGTRACVGAGLPAWYNMHEDDCCSLDVTNPSKDQYSAMEYTLFNAPSVFIRSSDTKLSQMKVRPINAHGWNSASNQYVDINSGSPITQTYDPVTGAPANMQIYHSWIDVATYNNDPSLVSYTPGYGPLGGALGPGTYRLRIDTINYDGSNPPGGSYAHKGLALRVADSTGQSACTGCTISAMDELSIYTPISASSGGGIFTLPLFQLPPDYAGKTISVDIWDIGDISGTGQMYIGLVDPTTGTLANLSPNTASVYTLGNQRSNLGTGAQTPYGTPNPVEVLGTDTTVSGGAYLDNKWTHFDVPVPSTYAPGSNPNNWWWSLRYRVTGSATSGDTITVAISLRGNPAHLLQS